MSHNVLITGASGYLGGDLLYSLSAGERLPYNKLYALVRNDAQAESVRKYGAEPLFLDVKDEAAVLREVLDKQISIVFYFIDALAQEGQVTFIKALGELKKQISLPVHFLHVRGFNYFYDSIQITQLLTWSCRLLEPRSFLSLRLHQWIEIYMTTKWICMTCRKLKTHH